MLVLKTWSMAGVSWKMLSILKTPQRAAMKMLLGQLLMEGLEVFDTNIAMNIIAAVRFWSNLACVEQHKKPTGLLF